VITVVFVLVLASFTFAKERQGEVTIQFNLNAIKDAREVRLLTYSFKVKRKKVVKKDFPKKELAFSRKANILRKNTGGVSCYIS
jgi:hypothetical protein